MSIRLFLAGCCVLIIVVAVVAGNVIGYETVDVGEPYQETVSSCSMWLPMSGTMACISSTTETRTAVRTRTAGRWWTIHSSRAVQ